MDKIKEIDIELKNQFEKLDQIISEMNFTEIQEFKLYEIDEKNSWKDIEYPGIYLLEIKNNKKYQSFDEWVHHFKLEWEDEKYAKRFTPNLKKKRIEAHFELNEWVPLYLGKSKNVRGRILNHIFMELHKTTFALKLLARNNLANDIFRLQTIKIKVENYDAIVPRIESQLRNRINPLIGKQ